MPAMNVSLTPELMHIIQAKVESGLYNNASEVVREAIRQMDTYAELMYEFRLARLKEALAEGGRQAEAGEGKELALHDILNDLNN